MKRSLVILSARPASELLLLFHGVGASATDLAPLGERLAAVFPGAFIVSVSAPHRTSWFGTGRQWFPIRRVSAQSRRTRVAAAMPLFLSAIAEWQRAARVGPEQTTLIGFSQGAVMALESTQEVPAPAARIAAIAGRLANIPQRASRAVIHVLHGAEDAVIPSHHSTTAAEQMGALGARVTTDIVPHLGHALNTVIEDLLIERLNGRMPG